jgi:hypothetical protein
LDFSQLQIWSILRKGAGIINGNSFGKRNKKRPDEISDLFLAGVFGFEPKEWRIQSPLPYRLAIPQWIKTGRDDRI